MTGTQPPGTPERRHFSRIDFDATATLAGAPGRFASRLLDVSLKGVLLARPAGWRPDDGPWEVDITLSDGATRIRMQAALVHVQAGGLGFRCEGIDLESIEHLRRLVELNLGDPALLDRELAALL